MSKVELLRILKVFTRGVAFMVLAILLGCRSESSTQQTKPPETGLFISKTHTSATDVSLVTEKTHQIYQWYCAQCHGAEGHGDGFNAPHLVVPPRDHTKATYLETRSNQQLFEAIKLGGLAVGRAPCMPAWGYTIDDKTIWSLVGYIRDLCDCEAL